MSSSVLRMARNRRSATTLWDDFVDKHPRSAESLSKLVSLLPPLNFITLHYAYFIVVCLVSSLIFWGSSDPAFSISYADSLYLVVSAMTEAGLNTVNLSQMTTWQQIILWLLILLGGTIWVSIWTILARKHVFEKRFEDIVFASRNRRPQRIGITNGLPRLQRLMPFRSTVVSTSTRPQDMSQPSESTTTPHEQVTTSTSAPVRDEMAPALEPGSAGDQRPVSTPDTAGHVAFVDATHPRINTARSAMSSSYEPRSASRPIQRTTTGGGSSQSEKESTGPHQFLSNLTVGRNGQFHDLSSKEREQLGGCEYRALKILATIVPLYFFLWQFLGCIALGAWINNNLPEAATTNGLNPWWVGIFNGASAFNNSGMSLLDANMIPFQASHFVLITMGLLILAGNTAYPIFLRMIMWSILRILQLTTDENDLSDLKGTLEFILKYPRRVYTNLFPSRPTWWLLFMLIMLNGIDWVGFELLNLGNPVIQNIPMGSRILDGLFQALGKL
jgi:hypothetical protein